MVSAIGRQHGHSPQSPGQSPASRPDGFGGKSEESVGLRARAQVGEAADTSANAQGKAASSLAALLFKMETQGTTPHPAAVSTTDQTPPEDPTGTQ